MLPLDVMLWFIGASAMLALAPGPDNIFVLSQSALHGRKAGICITLGLCTGLFVHIAAVTLGVAALLKSSPIAFTVLKIIGAGYLLYLAWLSWRAGATVLSGAHSPPMPAMALYRRGILMNISNPKVAIFFLAFLPQFVDPARGSVTGQLLILGALFLLTALLVFSAIAWAAGSLGKWLRQSPQAQVVINRVAAVVFVLLAIRLLFSHIQ